MFFEISDRIKELSKVALEKASPVFKGIDEHGFLLLEQEDTITKIAAGDVFI